jgi:hypothetical protein
MTTIPRPFTVWVKLARDEDAGARFLDHATRPYREGRAFEPEDVLSGVGRGFTLLRNARRWSHPLAGAGSRKAMEARGRQWRLVMAYGGFEILAKAHLCHFKERGPPHVSHFVDLAGRKWPSISKRLQPLPTATRASSRIITKAESLTNSGKQDQRIWHGWLHGAITPVDPADYFQLARVVRNLSAHGVLSPDVAIKLGADTLCTRLVDMLVDVADEVIMTSIR